MRTGYTPPAGIMIKVEQAVARGLTLDEICASLHVDPTLVDRVVQRMELAVAEIDRPGGGCQHANVAPCGTHAAFQRHRSRREPIDQECRDAEREYRRQESRERRDRRAA